ncbi:MAG: GIY-YIG nuclease family protein [Candidatus Limnocylindria bacterium]
MPSYGEFPAAYVFRHAASGEVYSIGSTDELRRRLFGNHLGGVGGKTTKCVHGELFMPEVLAGMEVTWIESQDWESLEDELKRQFRALGGERLPRWVRR